MAEITIQQRLDYWTRKIGVGSVWLTQEFNTSYLKVWGIEYDKQTDSIIVLYQRKDTPGLIHQEEVKHFLEYTVSHKES